MENYDDMKEVTVGVVLLLDPESEARAIALSEQCVPLLKTPEDLVLQAKEKWIPHLSLYHCRSKIPLLVAGAVGETLIKLGSSAPDGHFDLVSAHGRYVFWETHATMDLTVLMMQVVNDCNRVRTGKIKSPWAKADSQKRAIDHFGYANVGYSFDPHVTLSVIDKENVESFVEQSEEVPWKARAIAVCIMGQFGAIESVLTEYPLGER